MRYCADASFIIRLYDPLLKASEIDTLNAYLTYDQKVITMSEISHVEILNVLLSQPDSSAARQFEEDVAEGLRIRLEPVDWPDAFQQAESLARRFTRILRPSGQDLILVAAAVTMGAAFFLSYDFQSRHRPLATLAGLRVWPSLDKEERVLVKLASQQGI